MAYQNRVDPWGHLHANSSRGEFLGNKGVLHNEKQVIISTHKIYGWVTCRLEFKGRKRQIMMPNRYTELFFLDEATAFSAGHRPCAECRRERYNEFKEKWLLANQYQLLGKPTIVANIDKIIHKERIHLKQKATYSAKLNALPDGTMVQIDEEAYLIWRKKLFKWSFFEYTKSEKIITNDLAIVLTPKSYVEIFSLGFLPGVHDTLKE